MSDRLHLNRRYLFRLAGSGILGSQLGLIGARSTQPSSERALPSLKGAREWLNSGPLDRANLRGKVVLVDFWTYSCINWRRTLPYLRAWHEKYSKHGLVLIGVHTPEFDFEKEVESVREAVTAMRIKYPVALDNDYAIWRSFNNEYWPALYFVDGDGSIQTHHFGEGDYEQSERIIQQLLTKTGARGFDRNFVSVDASGTEADADWGDLRSPENYLGYERTQNFSSDGGLKWRKCHAYVIPGRLKLNHWAVAGGWFSGKQAIHSKTPTGRIANQFHARDLHLVMGPLAPGNRIRYLVTIDGQPPGKEHGADTDQLGRGVADEPRMYQLIRQQVPIVDRRFEIEFLEPGIAAFSFTFG